MPIDTSFASLEKSTIVRTPQSGPAASARSPIGLLGRVAPGLVARIAEHRLFRPPRRPPPDYETALLESASPIKIGHGHRPHHAWSWPAEVDGTSDAFRLPRTALLVHGWAGRGGQLAAFARPLVDRGYRVVTFDAPGHGLSPVRRTSLLSMAEAILETAAWVGGIDALIAHSAGATASTMALETGLIVDRVAFVSPVDDISALTTRHVRAAGLGQDVMDRIRAVSERRLGVAWSSLRASGLAAYRHEPLLVVHDRDDRDVPHTQGQGIARSWYGSQRMMTRGLGHLRILRDDEVVTRIVRFVSGETTPPRSRNR